MGIVQTMRKHTPHRLLLWTPGWLQSHQWLHIMAYLKKTKWPCNVTAAMAGTSVLLNWGLHGRRRGKSSSSAGCARPGKHKPAVEGSSGPSPTTSTKPLGPEGVIKGIRMSKEGMEVGQSHNPNTHYRVIGPLKWRESVIRWRGVLGLNRLRSNDVHHFRKSHQETGAKN